VKNSAFYVSLSSFKFIILFDTALYMSYHRYLGCSSSASLFSLSLSGAHLSWLCALDEMFGKEICRCDVEQQRTLLDAIRIFVPSNLLSKF
jgi:uncharacterized iron-regulated membrane protein